MGSMGDWRSVRKSKKNCNNLRLYASAVCLKSVSLSPWYQTNAWIVPPSRNEAHALFNNWLYKWLPRDHWLIFVPPTAHGTSPTVPILNALRTTVCANDIPGPTPHVWYVSMSRCSGSVATTHWCFALRRRIEGVAPYWSGTRPSHLSLMTPPLPAMLLWPASKMMVLSLDLAAWVGWLRWDNRKMQHR